MDIWDICDTNRKLLDCLGNIREDIIKLETALKSGILIDESDEDMYKLWSDEVSKDIEQIRTYFEKTFLASKMFPEKEHDCVQISDETIEQLTKVEKLIHESVSKICEGEGIELRVIRKYTDFTDNNNLNQLSLWQ